MRALKLEGAALVDVDEQRRKPNRSWCSHEREIERSSVTRLAETKLRCLYKLPSKMLRAYEVDFLVFSGTALPTSRFVFSSVINANHSAMLSDNRVCDT